jgi:L,D-peptidoglycan transpeptidase YkuD (ErfK/YbiS/YcfS/YnhG family)
MKASLRSIDVRRLTLDKARGRLFAGGASFPCALGPAGIAVDKREGDGATPRAVLPMRRLWRRADRALRIQTGLPVRVTRKQDGWCDGPADRSYNRPVKLPFSGSCESMWREDWLYDLVVELGWNDRPARRGRGSAIFLHAARPGFPPTAGCVALAPTILRRLLARMGPRTVLRIGSPKPRPLRSRNPR